MEAQYVEQIEGGLLGVAEARQQGAAHPQSLPCPRCNPRAALGLGRRLKSGGRQGPRCPLFLWAAPYSHKVPLVLESAKLAPKET